MGERLTVEDLLDEVKGLRKQLNAVTAELDAVRRERDEADALCAELRRDLDRERRE